MKNNFLKSLIFSIVLFVFFGVGSVFASCEKVTVSNSTYEFLNGDYTKQIVSGREAWINGDYRISTSTSQNQYAIGVFSTITDNFIYTTFSRLDKVLNPTVINGNYFDDDNGNENTIVSEIINCDVSSPVGFFTLSSTGAILASFSETSSNIFDSFFGWLCLIMGLLIAWYIIDYLVGIFKKLNEDEKKFHKRVDDLIERGNKITNTIKKYEK